MKLEWLKYLLLPLVMAFTPCQEEEETCSDRSRTVSLEEIALKKNHHLEQVQREFTDLRFGAFLHFGIMTFTGAFWATPNQDISKFNPESLDCHQWADAIAAAKMKFGILTTKHHDGFCLWDSKYTENDVANTPWKNGHGDVVREYVNAFRAKGLKPGLYYSVWDNTAGIGNGPITRKDMRVIKGQLTELLSNYGKIPLLFIDGWSWKMGHKEVPYDEIRTLVKTLQPDCLLVDNTHLQSLYDNDMLHFEAGATRPEKNTLPGLFSLLINKNSGNDWFWKNDVPTAELLSVTDLVDNTLKFLEPQWVTFVLNVPPNNQGLLDDNIVRRLGEVGQAWQPDLDRPPLPKQPPQVVYPITPDCATATSGDASLAIDGHNDRYYYTVWETEKNLPQSITIDLGRKYFDVSTLAYVPKYIPYISPQKEGSIKDFKVYVSTDNIDFTEVASGTFNGDVTMKVVVFRPTAARYVRFEALSGVDDFAAATEIAIGRGDVYEPTVNESGL
jgi:alpha-L-fucosidase